MKRRRTRSPLGQALLLAVTAGLILFMGWSYSQAHRAERAYTDNNLMKLRDDDAIPANTGESVTTVNTNASLTPANVLRLHIPANSDVERDQEIKEAVRDAVMERFGAVLQGAADADQAERLLSPRLSEIEALANRCLEAEGVSYGAKAYLKTVHFPEKTYRLSGDRLVYLPRGDYKALQLVLGSGKGANWWCVMYPPLCYFDLVQRGVIPGVPATHEGGVEGVTVIYEDLTEEVKVEVRSLLLDAIRAGISRIGEALSILAQTGLTPPGVSNVE
jgi:stage II sporulation protein R